MKIKILAVLAVVTVVTVSMFMNVEALATGEGTSPAMCFGYGSVVCPNDGSKVLYYW